MDSLDAVSILRVGISNGIDAHIQPLQGATPCTRGPFPCFSLILPHLLSATLARSEGKVCDCQNLQIGMDWGDCYEDCTGRAPLLL